MTARKPRRSSAASRVGGVANLLASIATNPGGTFLRARSRWAGVVLVGLAVVVGGAAAFLLVLIRWGLPNLPSLLIGFAGGALFGGALTAVLASRYPFLRKAGGFAILLAPLLVLLTPFLLIAGLLLLLKRTAPLAERIEDVEKDVASDDDPASDADTEVVAIRPARVSRRRKS